MYLVVYPINAVFFKDLKSSWKITYTTGPRFQTNKSELREFLKIGCVALQQK